MLAILGGGPGGYTAALTAAQKGLEVTLIEKNEIGGTCLNRGCIPTKALLASAHVYDKIKSSSSYGIDVGNISVDLPKIIDRKDKIVKTLRASVESLILKRKIKVIKGEGRIISPAKIATPEGELECSSIIIATGSEPLDLWHDPSVINSNDALQITEIPQSLLVVGAGAVGLEFACFFSSMGAKVTIVEMLDRILPSADKDIADTLVRELKKKGITIKTKTKIEKIENGLVTFADGKEAKFDKILSAVGRSYNTTDIGLENISAETERGRIKTDLKMETSEKGIYAIGDAAAGYPLLAHTASAQAVTAALNIAGEETFFNGDVIPGCIYTSPETASVGISEEKAKNPKTAKIPFRTLGRAHAEGEPSGLIKIISEDDIVTGVHIIGERATDLICEGAIAVSKKMKINELAEIIHAHPTFAEIYAEAYHLLEGRPIHVLN